MVSCLIFAKCPLGSARDAMLRGSGWEGGCSERYVSTYLTLSGSEKSSWRFGFSLERCHDVSFDITVWLLGWGLWAGGSSS